MRCLDMDKTQNEQRQADASDLALGRAEIGKELGGRSPNQVSWLLAQGLLDGAVKRVGHRTLIGSRQRLRALAVRLIDQS